MNPIDSFSFEDPDLGGSGFDRPITGWAEENEDGTGGGPAAGAEAVQDQSFSGLANAPDGRQWGVLGNNQGLIGSIYQQIGTVTANESITIGVNVANREGQGFAGLTVELWGGGTGTGESTSADTLDGQTLASLGASLLDSGSGTDPGSGLQTRQSFALDSGTSVADGEALWVRFVRTDDSGQVFLDNVTAVPEPTTGILGLLGGLMLLRRRRS